MTAASLGIDHPQNAGVLNSLAEIARKQRRFSAAKRFYSKALEIVRAINEGDEPRNTIACNMARLFHDIADDVAPYPPKSRLDFKQVSAGRPKDFTISARIRFPQTIEGELPVSNTMRWLDARAKFYESLGAFEKTRLLYELCAELCALVRGKRNRDLI